MRHRAVKFGAYLFGGVLNYAAKVGLTYIFTEFFGWWYLLSYALTISLVIVTNFFYNFYVTFRASGKQLDRFAKYVVFILATMILDVSLVKLLTDALGLYYVASIIVVTTILVFVKYFVFEKVIFK